MSDCLFCRIVAGELPSEIVTSTDDIIAIRDINPAAPVHVLVMPRAHVSTIADIAQAPHELLNALYEIANEVAAKEGIAESGYRCVLNNGPDSGMLVPHLHIHVLGGAPLGPIAHAGKGRG
jgi:histidine triad (HIT) family protein